MADPQKDEHIEELLSKLQGIFGKLSRSEEEESKQKFDTHSGSPVEPPKAPPAKAPPIPTPAPTPAPASEPTPPPVAEGGKPAEIPLEPPPAAGATAAPVGIYQTVVQPSDPEKLIVPTALFFPQGKDNEAKSLASKLEMMTPKFTKVAFRLRVIVCLPYDPKSDWKDGALALAKASESGCQTLFVVVDRVLDDTKKKAVSSECEAKGIYFQDVPMSSIEKKAYYTDILLGLVFYFDSHRPPASEQGNAA